MGRKKQKAPSSEEEEGEEEPQLLEDQMENFGEPEGEFDVQEKNSIILKKISNVIEVIDESDKFSWAALHSLKSKEMAVNREMGLEIDKIRQKYEMLMQPVYKKRSQVIAGEKIDDEYYNVDELGIKADKNVKVRKIQDFWAKVFASSGIGEDADIEDMRFVSHLQCQILSPCNPEHLSLKIKFSQSPTQFSNTELSLVVKRTKGEQGETRERDIHTKLKYKGAKNPRSIFCKLFDEQTDAAQCVDCAFEIYSAYSNAMFFYFEDDEDIQNMLGDDSDGEGDFGDEEDEEEQEEEGESDQKVEQKKPCKKKQLEDKKKGKKKAELEKPDCKQQ